MEKRNTILVVDDLPDNIEIISRFLEMRGHHVVKAYSGVEALKLIPDLQPDLILLDIMMPKITGLDVCRQLKADELTQRIPVIFMTALDGTLDKIRGLEAGAVDYVTKPLHHQEVITRVETHLAIYNQQVEIERLREQERRTYEHLTQIKDEIMRTASHDLKSPLSSIKAAIHLLEKHGRLDDERGERYLSMLKNSADQMFELIRDLLDIAKLETGLELHADQVDLQSFLDAILTRYQEKAALKKIDFKIKSFVAEGESAYFDALRISQVLDNLLTNAIKFTDEKGEVEFSIYKTETHLVISVKDNGIGIAQEDHARIFEKFYRVGDSEREGTGLGLAIVRSIVEQHGGKIQVESQLHQGSTFTIQIPQYIS
mgnify:CR=1 FL=1